MAAEYRVLGVGSPIVDLLVNVSEEFIASIDGGKGGMELVDREKLAGLLDASGVEPEKVPGGSAGNTIFGLAELNVKTSFLGMVGYDDDGKFYTGSLEKLGGGISNFRYSDTIHTGCCLSLITPDSERTMRTDLGAAAAITPVDVSPEIFQGISHVHVEGYVMFAEDYFRKVLETAKAAGCVVSLDLASFEVVGFKRDILPEVLEKYVDIVFANEDEARAFCGDISPEEQALNLNKYCPIAAVKLGKEGCCIAQNGTTVRVPAVLAEKVVDTTGAGDLWQTGFLFGLLDGRDMTGCATCGSVLGAEVVQVIGAKIPRERWDAVKKIFYRS
ncbi:MAG: adenosine kinase [Victivallales bacterium]|nr:adenosine kinase [Victivallales bacterium]